MSRMTNALCALLATAMLGMAADAEPADTGKPKVDKSVFNLFNPTPAEYLRAMDTDGSRGGSTESPYTVDAGHFQVEMSLVGYTSDRESFDGVTERFEAWAIAPMNLKIGLLNQLDAELLLEPYNLLYEREDGSLVTRRGFGDTTSAAQIQPLGQRWRAHGVRGDAVREVAHQPGGHRQPRGRGWTHPAAGGRTSPGLLPGGDHEI